MSNNILSGKTGFSIIEVMVGMAIFAIGILAVGSMQISAVNGNASARRTSTDSALAQEKMEELLLMPFNAPDLDDMYATYPPETKKETKDGYEIEWEVTPVSGIYDPVTYSPVAKQVQVEVTNPRGEQIASFRFLKIQDE